MTVFPTLVDDQVQVRIRAEEAVKGSLWISDALGRKMVQRQVSFPGQSVNFETFAVGQLPAGTYFLSILNDGKIATPCFMVK